MASYLVMTPPGGASNPDSARFIRDGFSFFAFFLPLIFMLWHRMWLYALFLFLGEAFLAALSEDFQAPGALVIAQLALSLLVGLESGTLRAAYLRFRGWQMTAVVRAENLDQAEEIYFSSAEWPSPPAPPATGLLPARGSAVGPALGLFDYGKGH